MLIELETIYGKSVFIVDKICVIYKADNEFLSYDEIASGVKSLIQVEGSGPIRVINSYEEVIQKISQAKRDMLNRR